MTTLTVAQLVQSAAQLTVEQQLALNKALCQMIKSGRRVQAAVAGSEFRIGDVVRFNAKTRGIRTIKIEKFNRAGTAVVGWEVDAQGVRLPYGTRWTVANTLCSKVG